MTSKTEYSLTNINLLTQDQYSNIDTTSDSELYAIEGSFVIDYDISGTSQYMKWSTGKIEQAGTGTDGEVTFPYEMATSSYFVALTPLEDISTIPHVTGRTLTGFTYEPADVSMMWKAEGY